ncbi:MULTISPECIES: universal stress protein [Streptomyces]|uniref:universal stress protein n=1 Tax=Streptomyces TaxID=1883 RepID=UPI00292F55FC|nr:universal stress protein [Streptomyces sp. NEAU-HV9]
MDLPLVVGVDGSEPSLRAVDWAADEAVLRGVPLRLVYASLWERYEGTSLAEDVGKPSEQVMAEDIVAAAARRAAWRRADVKISTEVLPEEPEYALVRESRNASALVMGTRGRSGMVEMLLGSVSLAVAAHADCPVIVLRGSRDQRGGPETHGRIVVGVEEGPAGSEALRFAAAEAELRGVPLEAVRAWRHPAHLAGGDSARLHEQRATETLEAALGEAAEQHPGVDLRRRTVEGHARRVLPAVSRDAGLLVVGAERKQGSFGLQLGRVTHGVLHHAACPVAVVPRRA